MNDKISVIIPVYNVESYLEKCITSIINQTYNNLQIIIVDDGSTDCSGTMCNKFAEIDSRIEVIHRANGGLSSARNEGLRYVTGSILSFIDSDDWIELDFYENMINYMEENSVDIVMCGVKAIRNHVHIENRFLYFENNCVIAHNQALQMVLQDKIGSQVWCKIYKMQLWDGVQFPGGRLYEDIPTTYKIFARSTTSVGYVAKPMYNYVLRDGSISLTKNPLNRYSIYLGFRERFEYAKIHFTQCYEDCLILACDHALSVCRDYYLDSNNEILPFIDNINLFLNEYKKDILKSSLLNFRRKVLFVVYFSNKKVFRLLLVVKKVINNLKNKKSGEMGG